jgi:hypothetical protein
MQRKEKRTPSGAGMRLRLLADNEGADTITAANLGA